MISSYPYIFGFENGLSPERATLKKQDEAFENFLLTVLGKEEYEKRNNLRLMEKAISIVVHEILSHK